MRAYSTMPDGVTSTSGAANTFREVPAMPTIPSTQFYVYVLCRPNGTPFYVGKGKDDRVFHHDREARRGCRCHKCNVIRKIWKAGGEVQRYIVFETSSEQEALDYEVETIALYGQETLTNLTPGGEGVTIHAPEVREKIRARQEAWLAKPGSRALIQQRSQESHADPEYRERARQAAIRQNADPQVREQHRQRGIARFADPAKRAAMGEKVRALWADPDYRTHMVEAAKKRGAPKATQTPEARASQIAKLKAHWADPDYRAKASAAMRAGWARKKGGASDEEGN